MNLLTKPLIPLALASAIALVGCGGAENDNSSADPRAGDPSGNPQVGDGNSGNNNGSGPGGFLTQEEFCANENTTLELLDVMPADQTINVAQNTSVRLSFNAEVDADTVNAANILIVGGSAGIAEATYQIEGRSITVTPSTALEANVTYEVSVDTGLYAECGDDTSKVLNDRSVTSFSTGDTIDVSAPSVVSVFPVDGETVAPVDTTVVVEFSEAISATSVTDNFTVSVVNADGSPSGLPNVEGTVTLTENSLAFTPNENLSGQTYYKITVESGITDLAGVGLAEEFSSLFRTGGLVVALDDAVVSQIPGLGDALNAIGGTLLETLEVSDSEDGLGGADNLLILKLPLTDEITSLDPTNPPSPEEFAALIDPSTVSEFDSVLIAVCDPKDVTPGSDPNCTLSVDLGLASLSPAQLQEVADAVASGDPEAVAGSFATAIAGADGLLDVGVLDDNGVPLPTPIEDILVGTLQDLSAIPVLGTLVDQEDAAGLLNLKLIDASLAKVEAGLLLDLTILSAEAIDGGLIAGTSGIIDAGGSLIDALSDAGAEPLFDGLCTIRLLCTTRAE